VTPVRLSGVYERICQNREGGLSHKVYFVFLCRLDDQEQLVPTEQDRFQVGMEWVDVKELRRKNLFPRAIRDNLPVLIGFGETLFLGSEREK